MGFMDNFTSDSPVTVKPVSYTHLNVTERSPHSMTVHYVDLSEDAAIAGTYKDFKFVNSTEYPIYIEGYTTSDKKITFNIYGKETRDKNRTISFESQICLLYTSVLRKPGEM